MRSSRERDAPATFGKMPAPPARCRRYGYGLKGREFLLLGEGADVVDQAPEVLGLGALALGRHVALAILNDGEELGVGKFLERRGIGVVARLRFEVAGEIAFAVAGLSGSA